MSAFELEPSGSLRSRPPARALRRESEEMPARRLRLVESTVLLLLSLLLAVATVNDVVLQTHVNHRLAADLRTWRQYTGHAYRNLSVAQDIQHRTTLDVVCGNTSPGAPGARVQLCLLVRGPVSRGRRSVSGGWYVPPRTSDVVPNRYGCFGAAGSEARCPR